MASFCCDNSTTGMTLSESVITSSSSNFIDNMDTHDSGRQNILSQTEKSLGEIRFWTLSELIQALKQCQDSVSSTHTSVMTQNVLACLVEKLNVLSTPSTSYVPSSEISSSNKFSSYTGSSKCPRNNFSQTAWWFKDLAFLNTAFVEKAVRSMISQDFDHGTVSKFLFYYRKSKAFGVTTDEKRKTTELVISLLCLLDGNSLSFKGLFNIYQAALRVKVGEQYNEILENLIGSQLDQATVDHLLIPSPRGKNGIYDVNAVLKLVKSFLQIIEGGSRLPRSRLFKVGMLMDSYLAEVAPDSHMKLSTFSELATILPDCARESHDRFYQAMDMYFEVHTDLCEEEKIGVCCALNYEKLSPEVLKHLTRNSKFPSRISVKAFMAQNSKLTSVIREIYHLKTFNDPWFCDNLKETSEAKEGHEKNYVNSSDKIRADLQGMNWKEVMELQNVIPTMPSTEMTQTIKLKTSSSGQARYFPKLCRC